tara:strand:- start:617 stop:751 length:135 start_codon:yes stop_codon:yes gene_type:complete
VEPQEVKEIKITIKKDIAITLLKILNDGFIVGFLMVYKTFTNFI